MQCKWSIVPMFTCLYLMVLYFGVILILVTVYLKFKKRIIRVITNSGRRVSCRNLYKRLQIFSFPSQYIFSLLVLVNKNRSCFIFNSEIHDINARHNHNLQLPSTNLTLVQNEFFFFPPPLEVRFITTYH